MSAKPTDRDEKPEPPPPCNATCPHEHPVRCTEPTGHTGRHRALGDTYPGYDPDKSTCTWKEN